MVSVVVPAYAWLNVWYVWLLCSAMAIRSSSSSIASVAFSSSSKLARSLIENFSLTIDAENWRQFEVCSRGTLARAHALLRQAESVPSDHTGPSSFAQRYGEI